MAARSDAQRLLRGCSNREVRDLLRQTIDNGARYRPTKAGLMLYGPNGAVSVHFTISEHRAVKNLRSSMRKAGL